MPPGFAAWLRRGVALCYANAVIDVPFTESRYLQLRRYFPGRRDWSVQRSPVNEGEPIRHRRNSRQALMRRVIRWVHAIGEEDPPTCIGLLDVDFHAPIRCGVDRPLSHYLLEEPRGDPDFQP